ncbi:SDR family oxidoreductase [Ruania halotolerans]|uniref:SDR family oxidoreductase n=1 Tax=Ruania halotolerans TaxID=2897773 RepID=UPI001E4CF98B|nr:SDR family oxidoreductase [Ruania halotolerans]UFU07374.1 SDR family oxidoreductase [Ruania halotolerans]
MSTNLFDLTGKRAVVTGARRGIGSAIVEALAGAGADIVGASAQMETDGGAVGASVRSLGRSFTAVQVDLADRASVGAFVERVQGDGPVDILVNNAGMIGRAPSLEHSVQMWDEVLEVNLTSQFHLAQAFGAQMVDAGRGKIIFTASLLSFQGGLNVPSYTASKSGLAGLTKALANEWAPHRVNVNAIAPGYIATDNTQPLQDDPDRSSAILDRIPAGRWGQGGDIGGAAMFLASAASDYVHGTVLPVDGGWLGR